MCFPRYFLWIIFFSSLAGEKNNMVTCSSKNRLSCSLHTYEPECDPQYMSSEYPLLFGGANSEAPADFPLNFRSKVISKNGTVGIMLIWQQYFRSYNPVIQGYQIVMEGKDGIDFGSGRCLILELQNKTNIVLDSFETFYLMIDGVQPMSTYGFLLYNLPRFNPFQQHTHMLETDVDTTGFADHFRLFSGNWDQYVECLFIKETNSIQILIEIPPNDFQMTLFDISVFDNFQMDIANININSSIYSVHQDQLHLFTNGYISTNFSITKSVEFIEVWVTPVDIYSYSPSKCLCHLRDRHCVPCRTATTKCSVGKEIIEALHHNDSTKDWNSLTNGKTDLIAWLCVGGLLMLASVCAFIVFRKQYGSCLDVSQCISSETSHPQTNLNNEHIGIDEVSETDHVIPNETDNNGTSRESNEEAFPLVDSYSLPRSHSDMKEMMETYFSFIPPETSSEMSKAISEQMVDINREFLPANASESNENNEYPDFTHESKSLSNESV
ncbi:uncharacterized protein LOC134714520 isoform X1 [Mytilus trossulus]|uniref:uncharacterized protein LOC134714520 isoform X1 n=2 Tax=Mytilus trossulus TaxID=6551 RepID=UPI0030055EF9